MLTPTEQEPIIEKTIEETKKRGGQIYLRDYLLPIVQDNESQYQALRERMLLKAFITQHNEQHQIFSITEYGLEFTTFEGERQRKRTEKELLERQIQSVIDTNESVRNTNFWMKIFTGLIVVCSIFQISYEKYRDTQQQESNLLWQNKLKTLDNIQLYLKGIDSSIRQIKTDTFLVKREK